MVNKLANRHPTPLQDGHVIKKKSIVCGLSYAVCVSILLAVGSMVYSNTLHSPFIFDDIHNILQNSFIRMNKFSPAIFQNLTQCPCKTRPVANFSFALDYYFHQYHLFGYHAVNIFIHVITGILLFLFFKITYRIYLSLNAPKNNDQDLFYIPFLGALLWLVHPVNTESVTYIVQRMTSMAGMFYILSLLLYAVGRKGLQNSQAKNIRHNKTRILPFLYFTGCVISGILALGSKQIAATLPIVILLYEWLFSQHENPINLKKLMLCLTAMVFFAIIAIVFLGKNPIEKILFTYEIRKFTVSERLLTEARIVIYYISLFFYPSPSRLNLEYDYPLSHSLFMPIPTAIAVCAIIGMIGIAAYTINKNRIISFCILWFLGNLVIESSIIPLDLAFEHRLYLIYMMPAFLFSYSLFHVLKNKWLAISLLSFLVLVFSYWTYQRNTIWLDETTIWKDCVSKSPNKSRPYSSLGAAYGKMGNLDLAINYFQKALRLDPDLGQTYDSIGYTLYQQGKYQEAVNYINTGLKMKPNDPNMTFHLASVLKAQGKYDQAMDQFLKVIQLTPYDIDAYYNLGIIQYKLDRIENAESSFQKAISIDPSDTQTHQMLGKLYLRQREYQKAVNQFNYILKLNPRDFSAYIGLGDVNKAEGNLSQAIAYYMDALSIEPGDADIHNDLGIVFIMQGKTDQAMDHLSKALEIDPSYMDAHINLGYILAQQHQNDEAQRHFSAVLKISPDNLLALINLGTLMASQNRIKEAVDLFTRVLQIDPGNAYAKRSLERLSQTQ